MLWDTLPPELQAVVLAHRAALVLQRAWLRHTLYGHARNVRWPQVRCHLRRHDAWRRLAPFARVRREWRRECESWLLLDAAEAEVIAKEAWTDGLWGHASRRVAVGR